MHKVSALMIVGIGIDVARIGQFVDALNDPATRFLSTHFTPGELAYARAQAHGDAARHLAARYAAKEAVIKAGGRAEGLGPRDRQVDFREIEVINTAAGAPGLVFHGVVADAIARMGVRRSHLSLSHEEDLAIAMVILES
ncbi:MAG: holo-ACP synthase [Deltaproteobacteria bacterium]|nr:holo-ACP synthase [Deltaproteobacteria bacterium]